MRFSQTLLGLTLFASLLSATSYAQNPIPKIASEPNKSSTFIKQPTNDHPSPLTSANSTQSPTDTASPDSGSDCHDGDSNSGITIFLAAVMAAATIAIAIFNYQLVGVTGKMQEATTKATEAAEAALHADRPFLLIFRVTVFHTAIPNPSGHSLEARIWLHNFGNGPADIVDYIAEAALFDRNPRVGGAVQEPVVEYGPADGGPLGNSLIAPHIDSKGDDIVAHLTLSDDDMKAMRDETKRVGIHGRIRYRGAPKQVYESRFFWWYFPDTQECFRAANPELNAHT